MGFGALSLGFGVGLSLFCMAMDIGGLHIEGCGGLRGSKCEVQMIISSALTRPLPPHNPLGSSHYHNNHASQTDISLKWSIAALGAVTTKKTNKTSNKNSNDS